MLETADDLHFAFAICFAFFNVIESRLVISHPDDHDSIQGSISLPVASPVEAMSVRFPARSWNRTGAAQFGESGRGTDAFRIVTDEDEHLSCGPRGDPVGFDMAGAQDAVKASRSASWALISASSVSQRRAIARKADLAEAVAERMGPGRRAARWRISVIERDHGLCSALHGSVARHLQVSDHLD